MESSVHLEQITQSMQPVSEAIGTIEEVHGPVVDIACVRLPPLHQALFCASGHERYIFEVYRHLDERRVRAIALHPTAGIKRGLPVYDSGEPLRIPMLGSVESLNVSVSAGICLFEARRQRAA